MKQKTPEVATTPLEERWGLADGMERILGYFDGRDDALAARQRLQAQANPSPPRMRERAIDDEAPDLGKGRSRLNREEPRRRVLTLAEQLYRAHIIDVDEWVAAGQLRNLFCMLEAPSEGVSSYGLSPGGGSPTRRADRQASRITGLEITEDGKIQQTGRSGNNRSTRWRYEDALFAMAGCHDEEGAKVIDKQAVDLMIRVVTRTEDTLTQAELGRLRSPYKGEKQTMAAGGMWVKVYLRRLALHFQLAKG